MTENEVIRSLAMAYVLDVGKGNFTFSPESLANRTRGLDLTLVFGPTRGIVQAVLLPLVPKQVVEAIVEENARIEEAPAPPIVTPAADTAAPATWTSKGKKRA